MPTCHAVFAITLAQITQVQGVHRALATVGEEGVLAFLDPTGLFIGTVDHIGHVLVIDLDVLIRLRCTLDDRGLGDGATAASDLQPPAFELYVGPLLPLPLVSG